ncbi:unnamed protein product [Ophioblennius macclurei]
MSSWVRLLLLALLAAIVRCGVAEGDALPAALVELVRNSPITSIEDLQLLLLTDSVDEDDGTSAANGGHRLPRSLDAQPAQQALCKVRTEVVEVTRAMLDRSNANFLLWPPCVEVQRCSGCCNAKSLQCAPVVTHTRYLQVMKIEYINKRPTYAKAVVSVVDHVECRCQPAPQPPAPKKKSSRRQHNYHLHRNQTHGQGQVKVQSKDELHQWDELKHNQRIHLEDLLEQHWNPRGDTFTQLEGGYSLTEEEAEGTSRSEDAVLFGPHWSRNSTVPPGADGVGAGSPLNGTNWRSEDAQTLEDKSKLSPSLAGAVSRHVTPNPPLAFGPTGRGGVTERVWTRVRPTKEPNPDPPGPARRRENETPEERVVTREEAKLEEEKNELLLLHKRLDQEKEILRQEQMRREEVEKEEAGSQHHGKHHHHHHHHPQTTTQRPETTTATTTTRSTSRPPSAPASPKVAARPKQTQRRRLRKNRKRISKAAMRAMLM